MDLSSSSSNSNHDVMDFVVILIGIEESGYSLINESVHLEPGKQKK